MDNEKIEALAKYLDIDKTEINDIEELRYNLFKYGKEEYLILTDEEANEAWDEELDHYIDDCILPEIPEQYHCYFDEERWQKDAKIDGRGQSLNRYDGNEEMETIDGTDYYIYRQN